MIITKLVGKDYLFIDNNYAELVSETEDYYQYKLSFKVNLTKCLSENIYFTSLKLIAHKLDSVPSVFNKAISNIVPDTVLDDLSSWHNRIVDFTTTKIKSTIFIHNVDLRGYFDVNFFKNLNLQNYDNLLYKINLGKYDYQLKLSRQYYPKFNISRAVLDEDPISNSLLELHKIFNNQKIDFVVPDRFSSKDIVFGNIENPSEVERANSEKLPITDLIKTISTSLFIKKELIQEYSLINNGVLQLEFSLLDNNGKNYQKITKVFFDKQRTLLYFLPKEKCTLQISQRQREDSITVGVTANDQRTRHILLYAKTLEQYANINQKFKLINTFDIDSESAEYYFKYPVNTKQTTVFRAVSVGAFGAKTNVFVENIYRPSLHVRMYPTPVGYRNLTVYFNYMPNGIELVIEKIGDDIAAIVFEKRNLLQKSQFEILSDSYQFITNKQKVYAYLDKSVMHLQTYEYRVKLINKFGDEYYYPKTLTIEYIPLIDLNAKTTFENTALDYRSLNVEFDLNTTFFISPNIVINKILYEVDRLDLKTGELVHFGRIEIGTKFSEELFRDFKLIKKIEKNHSYKYVVRTIVQ